MELQKVSVLEQCKIPTGAVRNPLVVRGILQEAKDGSRWWQDPETFGLFLLL